MESTNKGIIANILTRMLILLMYLVSYSKGTWLFWGFFIMERLMAFQYDDQLEEYLINVTSQEVSLFDIIISIVFIIMSIGIFIIVPFLSPRLFLILIAGEVIDYVLGVIRKSKKNK